MLKVQVNQKDLSHIFACIDKLKVLVTNDLRKSIPEQCAREFAGLLKTNIAGSAKYSGVFKALGRWKRTEPNAGLFWKWTGVTESLVGFHKINESTWFAGWGTVKGSGAPSVSRRKKIAASVEKRATVLKRNKETGKAEPVKSRREMIAASVPVKSRREMIAASVKKSREKRKAPPAVLRTTTYTKEQIAAENAKRALHPSTIQRGTRVIDFGKEGKKYKEIQHN